MPLSQATLLPLSVPPSPSVKMISTKSTETPGNNSDTSNRAGMEEGMISATVFVLGLVGYGARKCRGDLSIVKLSVGSLSEVEIVTDEENEAPLSPSSFTVCLKSKSIYNRT